MNKTNKYVIAIVLAYLFLYLDGSIYAINDDLTEIALKFGTDKSYLHNYTPIYEVYFNKIRHLPLKFLEIGFDKGNSARTWHEYFPNAILHFIDIDQSAFDLHSNGLSKDRTHLYLLDQSNKKDLQMFIEKAGSEFDIIIDDGGHTMKQQIISFQMLFPLVKSGGLYIIEDLHTSYWQTYNKEEYPESCVNFLKRLIDDVNFIASQTGAANTENISDKIKEKCTFYQLHIKSLHFYSGICFIVKR